MFCDPHNHHFHYRPCCKKYWHPFLMPYHPQCNNVWPEGGAWPNPNMTIAWLNPCWHHHRHHGKPIDTHVCIPSDLEEPIGKLEPYKNALDEFIVNPWSKLNEIMHDGNAHWYPYVTTVSTLEEENTEDDSMIIPPAVTDDLPDVEEETEEESEPQQVKTKKIIRTLAVDLMLGRLELSAQETMQEVPNDLLGPDETKLIEDKMSITYSANLFNSFHTDKKFLVPTEIFRYTPYSGDVPPEVVDKLAEYITRFEEMWEYTSLKMRGHIKYKTKYNY